MHNYTKYFKEQPGFDRFIEKIYEKYQSISAFSGVITLNKLTKQESESLSRLFAKNYSEKENIKISVKKFIAIMNESKYEDFDIGVLVEEYLNRPLITKKEKQEKSKQEEEKYYQSIIQKRNTLGTIWLDDVIKTKKNPYKLLQQRYHKDREELKKDLENIINLMNHLPEEKVLLPLYASLYTKDPHYLDLENRNSKLFFYALSSLEKTAYPKTREERIKMLARHNIEIDNLSNFVITYNLLSSRDYMNEFAKNKESLILNIQNIVNTESFDTKKKKVFIFENPSILTEIISRKMAVSIIISGGFPNSCVYLLLDKLITANNKLYYNGDFDPEGLLIAEKLKEKYKDNLELICYEEKDYHMCISKNKISKNRLQKLGKVKNKNLLQIKTLLLEKNFPAYQENNKERIIEVLKQINEQDL